jgi:hypothetical protein
MGLYFLPPLLLLSKSSFNTTNTNLLLIITIDSAQGSQQKIKWRKDALSLAIDEIFSDAKINGVLLVQS